MASNALEVLSLEAARSQIRADDGDEINALITSAVKSAVSYVIHMTGIPLVDRDEIFNVSVTGKTPMILPIRDVKMVQSVKFWRTTTASMRLEPTGTVATSTIGRIEELSNGCTRIWYPTAGWPATLESSPFRVTVQVGFDITEESESLREAVILMARAFFEQPDRLESDFAVMALIEPWKRYGG